MSDIRYEWINNYACGELDIMRKMLETHDFSQLGATIERLQIHCSSMENALYRRKDQIRDVNMITSDEKLTKKERLAKIAELTKPKD